MAKKVIEMYLHGSKDSRATRDSEGISTYWGTGRRKSPRKRGRTGEKMDATEQLRTIACPKCEQVGTISLGSVLVARPLGTWSLAGQQMKTSAVSTQHLCARPLAATSTSGRVKGAIPSHHSTCPTYSHRSPTSLPAQTLKYRSRVSPSAHRATPVAALPYSGRALCGLRERSEALLWPELASSAHALDQREPLCGFSAPLAGARRVNTVELGLRFRA